MYPRRDNPYKEKVASQERGTELPVEEITADEDIRNFYITRELNRQIPPEQTGYLNAFANKKLEIFKQSEGRIKIFAIKEQGQIVAGGQVTLKDQADMRRAYLSMKYVKPSYQGNEISARLVQKRLDFARESGCKEAYSLVRKENYKGMRAILKDGFDVSTVGQRDIADKEQTDYFVARDLDPSKIPTSINLNRVKRAMANRSLEGSELLIPFENQESIEQALQNGFVGKFVFDETDEIQGLPQFTKQVMYLEKALNT